MVAFWHLWDCLTTLQRTLPWARTTDPAAAAEADRCLTVPDTHIFLIPEL